MTDQQKKAVEEAAQAQHLGVTGFIRGAEEVLNNPEKYGFISKQTYDHFAAKYRSLMAFYDKHVGTPCEEIRHREEVEDLKDALRVCHASLCTYGHHPIIDRQVNNALKGGDTCKP